MNGQHGMEFDDRFDEEAEQMTYPPGVEMLISEIETQLKIPTNQMFGRALIRLCVKPQCGGHPEIGAN